jgi:tetratricopeptide (TPR) repeat protein
MHRPRSLLLPAPAEPFAGWVNVHEVDGPLGGALLMLARSVQLWTETLPAERGELFAAGGEPDRAADLDHLDVPEALAGPFHVLATLRSAPGEARAAAVSQACDAVSARAEAEGHPGVAIAWARLAAVVYPANVAAAYRVGLLARRGLDYATAEAWLQHAGALGRKHGEWILFVRAMHSLGNLHAQRGDFAQARAALSRGLQAAQRPRGRIKGGRKRLQVVEGEILHDLMVVAVYAEDFTGAERYAAEAFERMRAGHRRLPVLAHDVAGLWMERGYFARALPVFEAVLPLFHKPNERLLASCNAARCAGAEGNEAAYTCMAAEAWGLIGAMDPGTVPAGVYTNLARGAAGLRLWSDAEHAAMRAAEAAAAREEADQAEAISPLLESIRLHRFVNAPPEPASRLEERIARSLATDLVESLAAMRAGE